ncbi:Wall-associated kinase family protein [Rhynchospora pubera]|uniref:Wall-associated kinase family protein n=1 Tax=Rhynchospora pubera TaxID=906938 RepID=A0AAV8CTR4_9POAL|nr:Wall-associated kinase family protein [Rhynchospora pubera]
MHPVRLSTSLLLLICFTSATIPLDSLAPEAAGGATDQTSRCTQVPFPFGVPDIALDQSFEVVCIDTTTENRARYLPNGTMTQQLPPSLKLPSGTYFIQNISLQGQVRIFTGPIYQQCSNGTDQMLTRGNGWLNLTGTPFTLSKNYTTLVVIGCDDFVMIKSIDGDGNNGTKPSRSGCVAFCTDSSSRIDGSCSGLGCCQMSLPGSEGLKGFDLNLYKLQNVGVNNRITNCSVAFFTTPSKFSFRTSYYDNKDYFDSRLEEHVVVLDWAIGNKTCAEAKKDVNSFACQKNSQCYDSPNGVGYFCNCTQGYEGNPYIATDCKDVNECLYPETNPCTGYCINTEGSFMCACPSGMTGDGRKDGSGCKKKAFPLDVVLGVGLGVLFILVLASFISYWGFQKRKIVMMRSNFFRQNGGYLFKQRLASQSIDSGTKIFTEKELAKSTDNYSENNVLGQGGYGTVYKGILSDLKVVAIKKSRIENDNQIEQFINEITILSQINHRNVVKLLGCCLETQVPLLVYEFIPNGTLLHLIRSKNSGFHLPWDHRLRISAEAAGAIAYLHSAASFPIIHRDIKSSNILLNENFVAKVSDFGASRSVPFDKTHLTTLVKGTIGYLDPEYFQTSLLTEKSDVYSFGVVLAELLTGEKPISVARSEEFHNLAMYFTAAFDEDRLLQVIDPPVVGEAAAEELYIMAHLTKRCLNTKGEERPTMKQVALELEALMRRNQQGQTGNEEMEPLLVTREPIGTENIECTNQYSLELHMLLSMDLPR